MDETTIEMFLYFSAFFIALALSFIIPRHLERKENARWKKRREESEKFNKFMRAAVQAYKQESNLGKTGEKLKHKPYNSMSPKEFEGFVASVFNNKGYMVKHVGGSGDEGIDIIIERGLTKGIVQCKRYKSNITPRMVREFAGALSASDAEIGYFVTSSDFSHNAIEWAQNTNVKLINGKTLRQWWAD